MKKNRIIWFILLCLVSLCWSKADALVAEVEHESAFPEIEMEASFSCPDASCRIPDNTDLCRSWRMNVKTQRQFPTKMTRTGFSPVKAAKAFQKGKLSICDSVACFPLGINHSEHYFISLRKFIL